MVASDTMVASKHRTRVPSQLPLWHQDAGVKRTLQDYAVYFCGDPRDRIDPIHRRGGAVAVAPPAAPATDLVPARQVAVELLQHVAFACSQASEAIAMDASRSKKSRKPAPPTRAVPFAVELNEGTFKTLLAALTRFSGVYVDPPAEGTGPPSSDPRPLASMYALVVASQALKCNLEHLVGWKVPVAAVGFTSTQGSDDAAAASKPSQSAAFVSVLNRLLEANPTASPTHAQTKPELRQLMADSLSVGMPVFCATPQARLNVLASLVQRMLQAAPASGAEAAGTVARADGGSDGSALQKLLMAQYFRTMAEPGNVVSLVAIAQPRGNTSDARAKAKHELSESGTLGGLLNNGLTLLLQHTETMVLNCLNVSSTTAKEGPTTKLAPHIASLKEFLVRSLTIILSKALDEPTDVNPFFKYSLHFTQRLSDSFAELLEFCGETSRWPAAASGSRASDVAVKSAIVDVLQGTTGSVLTVLFTTMWLLPLHVRHSVAILPPLKRLLRAFGVLGAGLPDLVVAEADYATHTPKMVRTEKSVTAETLHPVPSGTTEMRIHIPGAHHGMTLEFSQESFQRQHQGATITLFGAPNQQKPLPVAVDGPQPVKVDGTDTVYAVYDALYQNGCFGMKVHAKAAVFQSSLRLPWLLDTMKAVAQVAGRCACSLVRGDSAVAMDDASTGGKPDKPTAAAAPSESDTEAEKKAQAQAERQAVQQWLNSELVANGLADGVADDGDASSGVQWRELFAAMDITEALPEQAAATPPAPAGDETAARSKLDALLPLVAALEIRLAAVPVADAMLPAKAQHAVAKVVHGVVIVMLMHNHLLEAAQRFVADTPEECVVEPPTALVRVWKTSHRIKLWLRTRFQTRLLDATKEAHRKAELAQAARKAAQESKVSSAEADSKVGIEVVPLANLLPLPPAHVCVLVCRLQEEVEETKVRRAPIYKKLCGGVLRVCRLLCRISPVAQALPSASPPGLMKRMSSQSEASTCLHGCGDHTVASAHLVVPWHGCVILSSWFNLGGSRRRKVGQASEGAAYGRCVAVHPGHGHRPTC